MTSNYIMRMEGWGSSDDLLFLEKVFEAKKQLSQMFTNYKYNEVFLAFNGGKDCTVLLHLIIEILNSRGVKHNAIRYVYIQSKNPFDEVDEFVKQCELKYKITIETIQGSMMKALADFCDRNKQLKACLMGCRRTDPHCKDLNVFQETDPGWPKLLRVNPLLDWKHRHIWDYINYFRVRYCILYNYGYTSLGDKNNTYPNPKLRAIDTKTGQEFYHPAYKLQNGDEFERAGRT